MNLKPNETSLEHGKTINEWRMRFENIHFVLQERKTLNRRSINRDSFEDKIFSIVEERLELIERYAAVKTLSDQRVRVIEHWFEEIEVLLNIDVK